MELNRASIVDQQFYKTIQAGCYPALRSNTTPSQAGLAKEKFLQCFQSQIISRHLDLMARILKEDSKSYYTIGSSGHEGNAAVAEAFQIKDMAFLHYRSGAFMAQRAFKAQYKEFIYDQLLSIVAAKSDPISGGRHKVFGSVPLNVPPQTSTIASHLPKALGNAFSIVASNNLPKVLSTKQAKDSVVLCSFGDASFNHSTAQGALNSTQWIFRRTQQLPIVWICEDNGLGISVPTPQDWIKARAEHFIDMDYISCDGLNLSDVYRAAKLAETKARKHHHPVFLHLKTIRLMGHAGSDIEFHYRTESEIVATEKNDPLLHSAHIIKQQAWLTDNEILELYKEIQNEVKTQAALAVKQPKLTNRQEISSTIIPPGREYQTNQVSQAIRKKSFGKAFSQLSEPRNMAQHINFAITDLMLENENLILFGEDVAQKGGVYRVTQELKNRFGPKRVFDTLLDEQTILGTAIGMAQNGFLPIPEIQFLAYTHNAADQIRGEAATLSYFSKGQFSNPMVIRIPGLAYQKGFGGHFHNDNAIGFLREIPGVIIACPSQPQDAALLLRECVRLAQREQRVVVFLEPIALYMTKDLFSVKDSLALQVYPQPSLKHNFQSVGIEGNRNGENLIISYANGMHLARKAQRKLNSQYNIDCTLVDLRWLSPLPFAELKAHIEQAKTILIVDETRKTGSISEELITWMVENIHPLPKISRITADDCFIPIGEAFEKILPSEEEIIENILELTKDKNNARSIPA